MSERKYGQRGYMDSDRSSERQGRGRSGSRAPRDPSAGPRGRGLGKPTASVFRCAVCGHQSQQGEVQQGSTCDNCGNDLHTCTHCRFFDTSARHECRQPVEQPVASKAKGNQCELFSPRLVQEFARGSAPEDPKAAFDALFKL